MLSRAPFCHAILDLQSHIRAAVTVRMRVESQCDYNQIIYFVAAWIPFFISKSFWSSPAKEIHILTHYQTANESLCYNLFSFVVLAFWCVISSKLKLLSTCNIILDPTCSVIMFTYLKCFPDVDLPFRCYMVSALHKGNHHLETVSMTRPIGHRFAPTLSISMVNCARRFRRAFNIKSSVFQAKSSHIKRLFVL